jgi:hypothetical protein
MLRELVLSENVTREREIDFLPWSHTSRDLGSANKDMPRELLAE